MSDWQTVGGVEWLLTSPTGPSDPAGREHVELGLVIAHGYAHEWPADLGLGACAVAAIEAVLARPVETPDRRVVEVSTSSRVGLQETVLAVSGEVAAVRHAAGTIARLLAAPRELGPTTRPAEPSFGWVGWGSELAAWFGAGPVSLAAEDLGPWSGTPEMFTDFVASLHPGRGRAVVAWTDAPELVGSIFADTPPTPPALRPLRWREPAPCAAAGSTAASHTNNLFTVRTPTGALSTVALRIVAQSVHRGLVVLTGQVRALEVTTEAVDTDELYALRAVPHGEVTDWVQVRATLVQSLDAAGDASDQLLAETLAEAADATRVRTPVSRALSTLRTGIRAERTSMADELGAATVDDLRRALQQLRAATLVSLPRAELEPPGRPLFVAPAPAPVEHPTVTRRSRIPVWLRSLPDRQRIRADATTLQQTLLPKYRSSDPGSLQEVTQVVDLTRLAARIDRGEELTTLVDADDRRLTLVWPSYHRPAALRRLVDGATGPGTTVRRGTEPMQAAQLRSDLTKLRVSTVLTSVLAVAALVLFIWAPVSGRGPEQVDVVSTVAVGEQITLGNGTTVRVSDPTWRTVETSRYPVLVVDVRYCGGGPTVDDDTGDDARNYLSPQRFDLTGIAPASRQTFILGVDALQETQLQDGQCTEGAVAFDIDADQPAGIVVGYHNGSGDRLGWTIG